MDVFTKTADEVLDYKVDFAALTNGRDNANADYLESGETISSRTVTVPPGITKDSDSITDTQTSITTWLSGGTAGNTYRVDVQIVTSQSRTAERSFLVRVQEARG